MTISTHINRKIAACSSRRLPKPPKHSHDAFYIVELFRI